MKFIKDLIKIISDIMYELKLLVLKNDDGVIYKQRDQPKII